MHLNTPEISVLASYPNAGISNHDNDESNDIDRNVDWQHLDWHGQSLPPRDVTPPAGRISVPSVPPIRTRKLDPLPYDVPDPDTLEPCCLLCGPPFQIFDTIQGMEVCSFECAKRYVDTVLAHPRGFKVKHSKTEPSDGTFGREGILLFLLILTIRYEVQKIEFAM